MLRHISEIEEFRGLNADLMPGLSVFGKKTVIFGANGSGKSSVSEFLRRAASDAGTHCKFKSHGAVVNAAPDTWAAGQVFDLADIRVFNHFYVDERLQAFLGAEGQSETIFKLGDNAAAASAEAAARDSVDRNQSRLQASSGESREAGAQVAANEKELKQNVVTLLGAIDSNRFSSYRFDIRAARALLNGSKGIALSPEDLTQKLSTARMLTPARQASIEEFQSPVAALHAELQACLNQTTKAIVIRELADDPKLASWVATGLGLHEADDTCKFCSGHFSGSRMNQLKDHFDDSTSQVISALEEISKRCGEHLNELQKWKDALPDAQNFYPDMQSEASTLTVGLETWSWAIERQVLSLQEAAQLKAEDFYSKVSSPTLETTQECPTGEVNKLIESHNHRSQEHSHEVESSISALLDHLAEKYMDSYTAAVARKPRLDSLSKRLTTAIDGFEAKADRHKAAQTDATFMASRIDEDVRDVFGRDDLEVVPSQDQKGYVVRRHGNPARHLSEGERKMIALSFFVRSLEADDVDRSRMIVVIDDPVSSLDRENMYAAFSWLQARLSDVPQTVVLTHDFELLRLYISATSNQRKESRRKIEAGDVNESWLPRVQFLEVSRRAAISDPEKRIQLNPFPDFLLRHDSEYHYLFHKVVATARTDGDDSLLPLVGNASRRLLEGFTTFEAPAATSFQEKVDTACKGKVSDSLKNRVVKFAHGQSHRDNPNPTTGVDLPSVRTEVQALLELIKGCNGQHFERMCKATSTSPNW